MRLFALSFVVAFLIGSALAQKTAVVRRTMTGVVTAFEPGRSISFASEQSGARSFTMELSEETRMKGAKPPALGVVVSLRYRRASGDPTGVVEEVRVIDVARR